MVKPRRRWIDSLSAAVTITVMSMPLLASAGQARPKPNVLAKAYEDSCVQNLRTINVAEGSYWGGDSTKGFARTLSELGPAGVGFLEPAIASGKKGGYRFRLIPERVAAKQPIKHYVIIARPLKRLVGDQKSYFTDETGVIRFTRENRTPKVTDQRLESTAQ